MEPVSLPLLEILFEQEDSEEVLPLVSDASFFDDALLEASEDYIESILGLFLLLLLEVS